MRSSHLRVVVSAFFLGLVAAGPLCAQLPAPPAPPPLPPVRPIPFIPRGTNAALFGQALVPPSAPVAPVPVIAPSVPPRPLAVPTIPLVIPPQARQTATPMAIPVVPPPMQPTQPPTALAWDADRKEFTGKVGDTNANFTFMVTNVYHEDVSINSVRTSCGCTVAKLPSQPWRLKPGDNGPIDVVVDLRGKAGTIVKSVTVDSTAGVKQLMITVNLPVLGMAASTPAGDMDRLANMQRSLADRQVVFKGECARCHSTPAHDALGQEVKGKPLYDTVCGICHDSPHRATMVPDLHALAHPTNADHWKRWITSGRVGSMMPAFARAEGGPLSDAQIVSLVDYLSQAIPSKAPAAGVAPVPATTAPAAGASVPGRSASSQ